MKHAMRFALLAALCLLALAACAHVDPSITQQSKIYRDAPVEKSKLSIAVRPKSRVYESPKVLVYPFWMAQKMENAQLVGRELARVLHNTWLENQVFETQSFDPQLVYRGPEQAIAVARRAGADLVVVGVIPYFYAGGTVDSSALSLQVRIYETKGGNLLFSFEQAARVNAKLPADWILFTVNTRMSDSPMADAVASMARDMAVPLKSWLPPTDEELGFADSAQAMTRGILASGGGGGLEASGMDAGSMIDGILYSNNKNLKLKIEFDFDSANIRPESHGLLDELAKALKSDSLAGRKVVLAGHCDVVGSVEYNQKLSERRAASVKAYLTEKGGVPAQSLRTVGYGKSKPLVPNTTPANRQRNRRVEVSLDK